MPGKMIRLACASLLTCSLISDPVIGQEVSQPIAIGERFAIESRILDETRQIAVGTPEFYDGGTASLGVLYVLDGDTNFRHAVTTTQFLAGPFSQVIPPLLVVAISTTDQRMRDMTPPSQVQQEIDVYPDHGGADRFLRFIVEELKPWVDEHYRTNGYSALMGHSISGLFTLHTLVTRPDSFHAYIAIDPSLWWNDRGLVRQADALGSDASGPTISLYLAVSEEGPGFDALREFGGILDTNFSSGFRWDLAAIIAESHETIPLPGTYQGLRWIFANWDIGEEAEALFSDSPGEDILEQIDDLYRSSGERLGFERRAPYSVFESLLNFLAGNDRLDEAAALSLGESGRYTLLPNVVSGVASLYVARGNTDAAIAYLSAVLEIEPDNATARGVLGDIERELSDE